jgi:hypothetical protein
MSWIIQLRAPGHILGERYYSSRGKNVVYTRDKAKVFSSKEDADAKCAQCTAWEDAKVIEK